MINLICSSRYRINRRDLKKTVSEMMSASGIDSSLTINLVFVGKNKMRKIAAKYKKENVALPVLSFDYGEKIGEVFICYPQAVLLAAQRNKKVEEILIYLIKHGIENILK